MIKCAHAFASDLEELVGLRRMFRRSWHEAGQRVWGGQAHDEEMRQLELAVHEATTNIIRHAYQGEPGRTVRLVFEAAVDRVVVSLYHRGLDFDPTDAPQPQFDGSQFGGFGLYLIDQLVDHCAYLSDCHGNRCIRLTKHLLGLPSILEAAAEPSEELSPTAESACDLTPKNSQASNNTTADQGSGTINSQGIIPAPHLGELLGESPQGLQARSKGTPRTDQPTDHRQNRLSHPLTAPLDEPHPEAKTSGHQMAGPTTTASLR